MSIQELPIDLIISICHEVIKKEDKKNALEKLNKTILNSIEEFNVKWNTEAIPSPYGEDFDNDIYFDELDFIIYNDIKKLNQEERDTIICNYGMSKAIKLIHKSYKIGLGDSPQEICEYLEYSSDISIEQDMIEHIIKDEIKFVNIWRNT
jgi:hypothetical protein